MADVYCYSGAAGTGTGASWTNAFTTLAAALTGAGAGGKVYVAHDHAETAGAAKTLTSPGTNAAPTLVVCVNRAGSVPPVAADVTTGAQVTTTGNFSITFAGTAYYNGVRFNAGSGAVTAGIVATLGSGAYHIFENCQLKKLGTTATSISMQFGSTTASSRARVELINTTLEFGGNDEVRLNNVDFIWRKTPSAITVAAGFTSLTSSGSTFAFNALFEGVDFSGLQSADVILGAMQAPGRVVFKDCKLHAGAIAAGAPNYPAITYDVVNCDSGDTNYRQERWHYTGTLTAETTIVRTGGASNGTTPIAWKIVTTADAEWVLPYESFPIVIWNETIGSAITLTVQGIWGGGAVPLNDEIWIDAEYLGTSGVPLGSVATSGKANALATGANIPAGAGTWGGSTTKFAMSVTITPQEKGPITVVVKAAKVSSTFYIDPKITVT